MKVSAGPDLDTIQMVDLVGQFSGIESEIREAFDRIFASASFIGGKEVEQFQHALEAYLDVAHVIPCGNGTDALQIALMALELKPGDEVIVPAFTFIASVEVIALLGYTPVVCDVYRDSFNMNTDQLEALITPKTRAIMPVHLFGQCCNMDAILDIAQKHSLFVVEDNAQSIGAHYTLKGGKRMAAGTMGTIGTTSFYPSKNLGGYGDGGALYTNDARLGAFIKSIANHGMTRRYYHDHVGVNSRLDAFQAAILNVKLKRLDQYNKVRIAAADQYDAELKNLAEVTTPIRSSNTTHVFHQYTIQVPSEVRDPLQEHLKAQGIPSMIYYPVPLQEQKAFDGILKTPVSLDITTALCKSVISLPMHSELQSGQVSFICDQIRNFFQN
jgi:dTDP-4-amino-4,6-dideoxygalactose transaminase